MRRDSTAAYVAPFAVFVGCMALEHVVPLPPGILYPMRAALVLMTLAMVSRHVIPWRPSWGLTSTLVGIAVFAIWVAPDLLWPNLRTHWLFRNFLVGEAQSTLPAALKSNVGFLSVRVFGSVVLVPIMEELFWRGWMMRWLISAPFAGPVEPDV